MGYNVIGVYRWILPTFKNHDFDLAACDRVPHGGRYKQDISGASGYMSVARNKYIVTSAGLHLVYICVFFFMSILAAK